MMKLVVLSCVLAAASASGLLYPGYAAPFAYSGYLSPYNYRGPLSLAPGQPANILAADGRPLDTLDVNIDRANHFTAKALEGGFHLLKKRSAIFPGYAAPLAYSSAAYLSPYNYRGPLSLAPGQPANILAADGRPLDTLDVNIDRANHFTAKALEGGLHLLKKRSAIFPGYAAPLAYSSAAYLSPYNYRGPLSLAPGQPANILAADGRPLDTLEVNIDRANHYTAKALDGGIHLLKKRSAPLIAPITRLALPATPIIAHTPLAYSGHYAAGYAHLPYATPIAHALY